MNTFNYESYKEQITVFPRITYAEFAKMTDKAVKISIIEKNKILKTDAYNRTMKKIRWEKGDLHEWYTLTYRKNAGDGFNIVYGIKNMLLELFGTKVTQWELDFATEFYKHEADKWWNNNFNREMRQEVIDKHDGHVPIEVKAVRDWSAMKAWEPILAVNWHGELSAIYEPVFMHPTYQSIVATDGLIINQLMHEWRIDLWIHADEYGWRSAINAGQHFDAIEALYVATWLEATSHDAASAVFPQVHTSGTIAHRFLSSYASEMESFEAIIQHAIATWQKKCTLLIDLINSYQWIEKAIALKKKYENYGLSITIRLDSGKLKDQVIYSLKRLQQEWLLDPKSWKIVVAGIENEGEIAEIEQAVRKEWYNPRDYVYYWLGELFISRNKGRSRVSTWFKLAETEERKTWKRSDDEGKRSIPWNLNVEIRDNKRFIVQDEEKVNGERLLQTVYKDGELKYGSDDFAYMDEARKYLIENFEKVFLPTEVSEATQKAQQQVNAWFQGQMDDPLYAKREVA